MPSLSSHPVRSIPHPRYPTHVEIQVDPDLLARHLPSGWLGRRELAGAVGLALAIQSSGCTGDGARPNGGPTQGTRAGAIVAPIFQHGDGNTGTRGMFGCIAVSAPVFLSEEEALAVIREELTTAGLNPWLSNVTVPSLVIDGSVLVDGVEWVSGQPRMRTRKVSGPLQVDLLDTARNIGVEFVSRKDFGPLGGEWDGEYDDDLRQAAASVSEQVKRKSHDMRFAALYDPITYADTRQYPKILEENGTQDSEQDTDSSEEKAKAESKRLLRLQVQDFVNWLKAQGAI